MPGSTKPPGWNRIGYCPCRCLQASPLLVLIRRKRHILLLPIGFLPDVVRSSGEGGKGEPGSGNCCSAWGRDSRSQTESKGLVQSLEDTCIFHRGAHVPEGPLRPQPHLGSEPCSGTQKAGQETPTVLPCLFPGFRKARNPVPNFSLQSCLVILIHAKANVSSRSTSWPTERWPWEPLQCPVEALEASGAFPAFTLSREWRSCSLCPLTVSCSPPWSSCIRRGSGSVPSGKCWGDTNHAWDCDLPVPPHLLPQGSSTGRGTTVSPQISPR